MQVLVVQNYDGTGLGQLSTALDEADAEVEFVRAHKGEALPDSPDGHDALIVLGGGQNARADEEYPYLPKLCRLMRAFGDADRSVLGICLGSQLLARAYGAENIIGGAREFSWREVLLTEDGVADPIFAGVPEAFPIFEWHDDTFVLPRGATRLAGNLNTHNQAFRVRRAAYGIQFHFEADRELVEQWSSDFAALLKDREPDWPERMPAEAERFGPAADAAGLAIARAWMGTVRAR
ncbi:type 1 glutamine amidotransferase [Aquamicrobium sp. LC103]|uniref:type 1 glutamine amidotransferase n=1 Tax=Aquamicrobium sp. LC103 TaxID=1120658 RepID=UPI00063EB359|nr:type 1 glutamine amidotransferase [Aquamicrobium sp. LC103]TKT74120.1 GMP synthase [Aquamicrobium sp. LC103]